jgi:ubiquinone/menaquinone biosynthesis C-methylase UbiE
MNRQDSKWKSKELSQVFLEGVRGAIPGATLQLEVLSKIVSIWCPMPSKILDLGCGDGVLGRALLAEYTSVHVVFADFSDPMIEATRKQVGGSQRATIIKADFSTKDWMKAVQIDKPFDVIVSGLAIHHVSDSRKKELYGEIYGLLSEGGILLNLDRVASATPAGTAIFHRFFVDHLVRFHKEKTREEVEKNYYQRLDKEEDILTLVDTQCQWLRDIGFQDVDCFFKIFDVALFGGRKTSNEQVFLTG